MADEGPDKESKTEEPSARKLRKAYESGNIPIGHDAVLVAGTGAACLALAALGSVLRSSLTALFRSAADGVDRTPFASIPAQAGLPLLAAAAVCATAAIAGTLATLVQTQGRTAEERPLFALERVFKGFEGLKQLGKKEFLLQLLISLGKAVFIAVAVWPSVRRDIGRLPALLTADTGTQLSAAFGMLTHAAGPAFLTLVILAGAELGLTRWKFHQDQRMTKEELKDEYKQEEGDPQIKQQRKRRYRDLLRNQATVEVPRADALVVNPTHVAVAIRYRRDEGRAPRVTAKGKGALAEHMRNLARQNGVAIVQDVPLARFLYRKVKVGREIPAQTYKAVAAILAFVYRMAGNRRDGARA
jgi:flagellar biosynthesis protein FlhB